MTGTCSNKIRFLRKIMVIFAPDTYNNFTDMTIFNLTHYWLRDKFNYECKRRHSRQSIHARRVLELTKLPLRFLDVNTTTEIVIKQVVKFQVECLQ